MTLNWTGYISCTLNVTICDNYGTSKDMKADQPLYEIAFKSVILVNAYDDGLFVETEREGESIGMLLPLTSVKCVEIFDF